MSMNFPFPVQQELTAIALAYRNEAYIADLVLPRVPVPGREFKWLQMTREDFFTVPETQVGRKGVPNEVQFSGTEVASFVNDYGLDDLVPVEDQMSAPAGYDPEGRATEGVAELVALDRERRTANLLTTLGTYPTANRVTLSGTGQWSDFANSDPYTAIMTAFDGMLMRPNVGIFNQRVWTRLRTHPRITAALAPSSQGNTPTGTATGRPATAQSVAELLELDAIYIGRAWVNTARPGQTPVLARAWGNHAMFLHQNPAANIRGNAITFGYTAEWGTRVAGSIPEPKVGLRGASRVRVGESVREIVAANDCGYLFRDAVA